MTTYRYCPALNENNCEYGLVLGPDGRRFFGVYSRELVCDVLHPNEDDMARLTEYLQRHNIIHADDVVIIGASYEIPEGETP